MATPFDSIGGLLGIDPEQLKQLMAALGPQEEDRKSANMQALTQLGLGLLGTRKGYEWEQLGNAGQNALMARQQAMQGAQAGRMDQVKMAEQLAKMKAGQDSAKARQLMNNEIGALLQGGGQAQGGDASPAAAKWQIYLQAAEKAALGGDMVAAKHWAELAEKHKPKFSTTPHVGLKDGKAGNFVLDDMGNEKPLGFAPPPEFLTFDDGKTKQVRNKYLMPESGMDIAMQTTPGQDQSAALQRAQMAQSERHFQANQGGGGKPQLVNGQWVFPPDAQNPTGRAVTPEGMAPGAGKTPPQAFMDKSNGLKNLSNSIADYNKSLETLSTSTYFDPTAATELMSRYTSLKMDLKNLYELGALAGPDVQILEEGLTNPASLKGFVMPKGHFQTQTKVLQDRLKSARKNLAGSYGQAYEEDQAPVNDYDSLPKGAIYTAPDGTKRRKQ